LSFLPATMLQFASNLIEAHEALEQRERESPADHQNRSATALCEHTRAADHESSCGIAPSASTEGHVCASQTRRRAFGFTL
jgi:hypothetical protein